MMRCLFNKSRKATSSPLNKNIKYIYRIYASHSISLKYLVLERDHINQYQVPVVFMEELACKHSAAVKSERENICLQRKSVSHVLKHVGCKGEAQLLL